MKDRIEGHGYKALKKASEIMEHTKELNAFKVDTLTKESKSLQEYVEYLEDELDKAGINYYKR